MIVSLIMLYLFAMPAIWRACRELASDSERGYWPIWLYVAVITLWPIVVALLLLVLIVGLTVEVLP